MTMDSIHAVVGYFAKQKRIFDYMVMSNYVLFLLLRFRNRVVLEFVLML